MTNRIAGPGTIRVALMATGFIGLTLTLILIQPGPRRSYDSLAADPQVTRAPVEVLPEPTAAQRAPERVMQDLAAATALAVAQTQTQTASRTDAPTPSAPAASAAPTELRQISWGILQSVNEASGRNVAPGDPGSLLHTIVGRAVEDATRAKAPDIAQRLPQTATTRAAEPLQTGGREYVVQPNDSLLVIAQRAYGDPAAFTKIYEANRDRLKSPEDLYVGQVLILP